MTGWAAVFRIRLLSAALPTRHAMKKVGETMDHSDLFEDFAIPETYEQCMRRASAKIKHEIGDSNSRYVLTKIGVPLAAEMVIKYREWPDEEHKRTRFLTHSDFVLLGCMLQDCVVRLQFIKCPPPAGPAVTYFHTAGGTVWESAARFIGQTWGLWGGNLGQDLEFGVVSPDTLRHCFMDADMLDYIVRWQTGVAISLKKMLPETEWPAWKIRQERERLLIDLCAKARKAENTRGKKNAPSQGVVNLPKKPTERQIEAFRLVHMQGLKQEVAAELMGCRQSVISRLLKTLAKNFPNVDYSRKGSPSPTILSLDADERQKFTPTK